MAKPIKIAKGLRGSMDVAFAEARDRRHEYTTVEHLLLAFLADEDVLALLRKTGGDLKRLRELLEEHLPTDLPRVPDHLSLQLPPSGRLPPGLQLVARPRKRAGGEERRFAHGCRWQLS